MGQFALGIRSLLVRVTIFVVMAALLAWALGGTLFPRPSTANFESQAVRFNGAKWYWRLLVGGKNAGEVRWHMMRAEGDAVPTTFLETSNVEVAGPVLGEDGVYFAGRDRSESRRWRLTRIDLDGGLHHFDMPDALAAAQQLARAEAGLPVQDESVISAQRYRVLEPLDNSADDS